MTKQSSDEKHATQEFRRGSRPALRALIVILGALVLLLGAGAGLFVRFERSSNGVALAASPKRVRVVPAENTEYTPERRYIATVRPWLEAAVGPQLVSAYVDTVLVRPGDTVKRRQVLATLDCRKSSAASRALSLQARALEARRRALVSETSRLGALAADGYVSPNELEKKSATTAELAAQISALEAQLTGSALQVDDCVLRSPFDGEVAARFVDPGSFVKPGQPVATVIERRTVRFELKVAERDFEAVAPGKPARIRVLATGKDLTAKIARRSPAASSQSRTVSAEIDWEDPDAPIPIGTTAEVWLEVGQPKPATALPLQAAVVRGGQATVFVTQVNVVKKRSLRVLGEGDRELYVEPIEPGAQIVVDGRALLKDGEQVEVFTAAPEAKL